MSPCKLDQLCSLAHCSSPWTTGFYFLSVRLGVKRSHPVERLRVFIFATDAWYGCNIRLGKILAFEQQRLARRFAQRISKTVAKIETCTMATFAETLIGI